MIRQAEKPQREEGGFTLVELLVVVVILGILSAVVVFAVRGADDKGKGAAVATDERIIRTAEEVHCAQTGRYASDDELFNAKLLSSPPEIHVVTAGDDPSIFPEGNCAQTPKHYKIECRVPNCGLPGPVQPTLPLWDQTTPLGRPRAGHTATLLKDGRVLVVGGDGEPLSAEVYDPAAPPTWKPTDALAFEVNHHTATLLNSGKVLVVAGPTAPGEPVAQIYDPAGNNWTPVGALPAGTFDNHTATLLQDGTVLVTGLNHTCVLLVGGSNSATVFDPEGAAGPSWGPVIPMSTERWLRGARAVRLPNNKVLVAGGLTCSGNAIRPAGAEIYDPANGTFGPTTGPPPYEMTAASAITLLNSGKVLMTGQAPTEDPNKPKLNAAQLFDPDTGLWSKASDMLTGHSDHTATALPRSGKVLVAGGSGGQPAELYDPVSNTWIPAAPMVRAVGYASATLLGTGPPGCTGSCVLVAGGTIYDPSTPNVVQPPVPLVQFYSPGSG